MRIVVTVLAFVLSLALVGVVAFFSVLLLAGPHGGLLPGFFEPIVLAVGWLVVFLVPSLFARHVWRRRAGR